MTIGAGSAGVSPGLYVEKFVQALNDPTEVWQHAFENQINDAARAVLYCLGTVDAWLGLEELMALWANVSNLSSSEGLSIENRRRFRASLKQLDGSFIRTVRAESETAVEFHNPSIKDFVRKRIASEVDLQHHLLRRAQLFEQVLYLACLSSTGQVGGRPNTRLLDDQTFHKSIEKTITARTGTYHLYHFQRSGGPRLLRFHRDLGERFSTLAKWAVQYSSGALLQALSRIAVSIVESGEAENVATIGSCDFLDVIVNSETEGDEASRVVTAFLPHMSSYMRTDPTSDDWIKWTDFFESNTELFQGQRRQWELEAEFHCKDEIDEIIRDATSSSQAEERIGEVLTVAERWAVSLEPELEAFQKRVTELARQEEKVGDEPKQESTPVSLMDGSDAVIDRLFESLPNRAD